MALCDQETFNYDDSLDVFGVHGVGGFLGTCLLGILGHTSLGGFNAVPMMQQTKVQCIAAVATALCVPSLCVCKFALECSTADKRARRLQDHSPSTSLVADGRL